jgi:RIO-like serine/threonine protein kinase
MPVRKSYAVTAGWLRGADMSNSIAELSPAAFTVLHVIRAHNEKHEYVSTGVLAHETHLSTDRVRECLRELVEWPERALVT